jgi:hypothetical protein
MVMGMGCVSSFQMGMALLRHFLFRVLGKVLVSLNVALASLNEGVLIQKRRKGRVF